MIGVDQLIGSRDQDRDKKNEIDLEMPARDIATAVARFQTYRDQFVDIPQLLTTADALPQLSNFHELSPIFGSLRRLEAQISKAQSGTAYFDRNYRDVQRLAAIKEFLGQNSNETKNLSQELDDQLKNVMLRLFSHSEAAKRLSIPLLNLLAQNISENIASTLEDELTENQSHLLGDIISQYLVANLGLAGSTLDKPLYRLIRAINSLETKDSVVVSDFLTEKQFSDLLTYVHRQLGEGSDRKGAVQVNADDVDVYYHPGTFLNRLYRSGANSKNLIFKALLRRVGRQKAKDLQQLSLAFDQTSQVSEKAKNDFTQSPTEIQDKKKKGTFSRQVLDSQLESVEAQINSDAVLHLNKAKQDEVRTFDDLLKEVSVLATIVKKVAECQNFDPAKWWQENKKRAHIKLLTDIVAIISQDRILNSLLITNRYPDKDITEIRLNISFFQLTETYSSLCLATNLTDFSHVYQSFRKELGNLVDRADAKQVDLLDTLKTSASKLDAEVGLALQKCLNEAAALYRQRSQGNSTFYTDDDVASAAERRLSIDADGEVLRGLDVPPETSSQTDSSQLF
jgi:malonyl CoA-acyl carrier protein transacylase